MASVIGPAPASQSPALEKLRDQAVELEGVFLNTLMKEMFASVKTDPSDFGGGFDESMGAAEYTRRVSRYFSHYLIFTLVYIAAGMAVYLAATRVLGRGRLAAR